MMPGMIMLWHGTVDNIPSGWHLCDGTMGTPDLRGKLARGAGGAYTPGATGGSNTHTHEFRGDGHAHDLKSGTNIANVSPAGNYSYSTQIIPATGITDEGASNPPFHQLCYIMKL